MAKQTWQVEVTDTFGGEANYCWVHRYTVEATTIRGAIGMVSRREGYRFRQAIGDRWEARYDARGACVCAFVASADTE